MAESLPLFVAVPMLAAGVLVGLHVRSGVRQSVLFAVLLVDLAAAGVLLGQVWSGRTIVHHVGLWDGGLSIAFAADVFAALMLVVTVLLTLLTAYFARQTKVADEPFFCPLVLLITCGVNGALLTADLFNLFVFVEIMLLPSYALVMLAHRGEGRRAQVSAARIYVIVNLFTSSLFLIALALIYSGTGTVSLGRLGERRTTHARLCSDRCCCCAHWESRRRSFPRTVGWRRPIRRCRRRSPRCSPACTPRSPSMRCSGSARCCSKVAVWGGSPWRSLSPR